MLYTPNYLTMCSHCERLLLVIYYLASLLDKVAMVFAINIHLLLHNILLHKHITLAQKFGKDHHNKI